MPRKTRLSDAMQALGLADSAEAALALIMAGRVRVGEAVVTKAGAPVPEGAPITVAAPDKYVGRGAYKLEAALDHFGIAAEGCRALDIGSSTGGFTDLLLQRGAAAVVCVDSGRGQLHWKIRSDPRVSVFESCNARLMRPGQFGEPFDLAVMDVSFISQKLIWPRALEQMRPGARAVALVKPQFEAARHEVERGGIVRDPGVRERVCREIESFVAGLPGVRVLGMIPSPIAGRDGNMEFLICAQN